MQELAPCQHTSTVAGFHRASPSTSLDKNKNAYEVMDGKENLASPSLWRSLVLSANEKSLPHAEEGGLSAFLLLISQDMRLAGIGTMSYMTVAGLHRASPSTSRDKKLLAHMQLPQVGFILPKEL